MKIAIGSDLHLEHGTVELDNTGGAEVLVLAGDICVAAHFGRSESYLKRLADQYRTFFDHVTQQFPQVVYILGNHEHYAGDIAHTYSTLKQHLDYPNLHILEKETWTHGGYTFIGGTLWTDMNRDDSLTLNYTQQAMSDFREILNSDRMVVRQVPVYEPNPAWTPDGKNGCQYLRDESGATIRTGYKSREEPARWSPEDTVKDHERMLAYTDIVTREPGSYIVVGHHCPSELSVAECYKHDTLMNGAFRSELDSFIEQRPQIRVWICGHTHWRHQYTIGETRVICNPRGYVGMESIADSFQLKYVEV